MSRFYQHVLTGQKVEVKTLDEDDYYVDNASTWERIEEPAKDEPVVKKPAAKKSAH
jgi:hypothetical protein